MNFLKALMLLLSIFVSLGVLALLIGLWPPLGLIIAGGGFLVLVWVIKGELDRGNSVMDVMKREVK